MYSVDDEYVGGYVFAPHHYLPHQTKVCD